jgi:hypothetical protein
LKGENNPKWQGGRSAEYKRNKTDKAWKERRRHVYERDNFTCQTCGKKDGNLHGHLIIPWRISFDDSLTNLISLCPSCHTTIEAFWSKINTQNITYGHVEASMNSFDLVQALWCNKIKRW